MIICPNLKNPEVAREFNELVLATSEAAAYHIWSLNNGNAIDKAPNGAESKLFLDLLLLFNGDRTKAIQAKAKVYSNSFLNWFGNWLSDNKESVSKVVDENGEPLIVYHKSVGENNDFVTFDLSKNKQKEDKAYSPAYHFGTKKAAEQADNYGGLYNIRPFFLSIKNPDTLKDYELSTFRALLHYFNRHDLRDKSDEYAIDRLNIIKNLFAEYGNDGYKYINTVEDPGNYSWAIFESNQAKLATSDKLSFENTNDIRFLKTTTNLMSIESEIDGSLQQLSQLGEELMKKCEG